MIEQGHRRIKQRIRPMLGFQQFESAAVTISGIELVQKIQKQQFKTGTLVAAQPQCRNFGMPCWPPDSKFCIAFRCWKDGVLYDDSRYLESLRRRGSPLVQELSNR